MKKTIALLITLLFLNTTPSIVSAHPGNTASDGCHYCRTNCDKWGVEWNARHCHASKGIPQPTEPVRSHYDESGGYTTPEPDYKIPKTTAPKTENKISAPFSNKANSYQTATIVQGTQAEEEKTFWLVRFFKFIFGF